MDVVTGAIGSLLSKLGELLNEEYKLQKSAPEKLVSLIKELECAHAALRKVDGVPPDQLEEQVRVWAREIRDASYDMEDEIDTFLVEGDGVHEEHSAGKESFFKSLLDTVRGLFGMPSKRRKIAGSIDDINKRLEDVTQRYGRYTVVDSITVPRPASIDPRLAAMYKEVTELVGIDKSSSELIAMLSPPGQDDETEVKMKMVSVVGAGGLGKTTLAKTVYDKLKVDFECSAFVPVGRNPDLKKVFRDILIEIDKAKYMDHKMTVLDERQLIDELRENLRNKRYLLVIDDLWETKSWEIIKLVLVQKNSGSRVITTTRILEVAKEDGEVYKLQHLPYGKSKKLFFTRIFGAEGNCPDNQLDEVSDKILKKCDGVPLAIITMASLLVGKSREEWIEVCSSIAFRDRDNKQVSDTEWILSLSYYDLPPHLKTCLLYLSVFPEDQVIRKDSLIWKWVAEGFVHKDKPGLSLFEIGDGYFNGLINRSMIQALESSEEDGMVVGCHVHDMVLDLLCLKSQEENFVSISSNNAEATSSPSRGRRLIHQNKTVEHTQMEHGHVRSFIACRCEIDDGFSFQSFKLLRVLALENCRKFRGICLKHLENLLHLRYLGLGYSHIHEIPGEIGALKFLQTLDLEGAKVTEELLPSSVGLLTQLICLRAMCMTAPNGVIEKLTSLEQLEICVPMGTVGHFVMELGKLRELRVLYAKPVRLEQSVERNLVKSLGNLHKIRHLQLKLNSFSPVHVRAMWGAVTLPRTLRCLIVPDIFFSKLPSCISPSDHPNLTHLSLCVHHMKDNHLKILGQLPELRHLKLLITSPNNAAKVTVTSTDGCFQKLRSLSLPNSAVQFGLNEDSRVLFVLNKESNILLTLNKVWSGSFTVGNSRTMDFSTEKSVPLGLNEDSSDSFTVGNIRTMVCSTKKRDKCVAAPAIIPNLQVLEFQVYDNICDNLVLDCLPSLQRVKVTFLCCFDYAERDDAVLRHAIESHPNRPTLEKHFKEVSFL